MIQEDDAEVQGGRDAHEGHIQADAIGDDDAPEGAPARCRQAVKFAELSTGFREWACRGSRVRSRGG